MRFVNSTKILIFILFLLLSNRDCIAQTFSVKGQIISAKGGIPIQGAAVFNITTQQYVSTNELGSYTLQGLHSGEYQIVISCFGFKKIETELSISKSMEINFMMENTAINLMEVTVNPNNLISPSEVITGVDRLLKPINSAQDLLKLAPGLFIAQHAGGGKAEQIFLRGVDCDHGTDFNITLDGMPVNMVSHAHGQGYADFHFVIPETIDRVKVHKGPYNARFGDFATTGTGEFITKNSIENNEVKAEIGMYNTYRTVGMFRLLDKHHLISKEKEDAYVASEYVFTNSYFDKKQNFSRFNLIGKYSGRLNQNNFLSISSSTFFANWDASGQIPQRAVNSGIIGRFGSIDPSEGGQTNRTNINAVLTTITEKHATIKNQIYFINYYFNLYSNFTFYFNDPVHGDEINQTDQRNIVGYIGSYQKDYLFLNKTLHTTAGIGTRNDFIQVSLKHCENRQPLDTVILGKVYQQNTNAYLDFTIDINKHLSINAGMRLDYFNFNFTDEQSGKLSGTKSILRPSPKLNFCYNVNEKLQLFIKSGIGFHSNDARSVVVNHGKNSLPRAYGTEAGSEFKISKRILINVSLWELYLEHELVYVGDGGTVETKTPTQRFGTDLSLRFQIQEKLYADIDLNFSHGRLVGVAEGENLIPLAPRITSIGGLTYKQDKGFNASLRYRYIDSRPANENNSVIAKGYFLLDALVSYKLPKMEFGLGAENLLNTNWNQAQFDTTSRLFNEKDPVSELHFTPGTPFFIKGNFIFYF